MSYEGYTEFICTKGHYLSYDVYSDPPEVCYHCGSKFEWSHSVDTTNGEDEACPDTLPGETIQVGTEDIENHDKYGNKYYTEILLFGPKGDQWRKVKE